MTDVICTSPSCMKPITDPLERKEKTFLVVETGKIITLHRHDVCAEKYESEGFKRVTGHEVARILSPAATRKRGLDKRRASGERMDDHRRSALEHATNFRRKS